MRTIGDSSMHSKFELIELIRLFQSLIYIWLRNLHKILQNDNDFYMWVEWWESIMDNHWELVQTDSWCPLLYQDFSCACFRIMLILLLEDQERVILWDQNLHLSYFRYLLTTIFASTTSSRHLLARTTSLCELKTAAGLLWASRKASPSFSDALLAL